jgi:hypothetical protein
MPFKKREKTMGVLPPAAKVKKFKQKNYGTIIKNLGPLLRKTIQ